MGINEITTKQDLLEFENRLVSKIKDLVTTKTNTFKKWIRTKELQNITGLSASSIQNMRVSGTLPYSKVQGTIFYDYEEVLRVLEDNKRNVA